MDVDITRHTQPGQQPQQAPLQQPGGIRKPKPTRSGLAMGCLCAAAVVVVLLVVGGIWMHGRHRGFNENKNVNSSEYQAVFLTNGQVYFGKLGDLNNKYVTIHDIYYLQVQQGSSTTDAKSLQNASSSTDTNAQVSLAKLGSELHGPEDKMYISSDQVLFWENLTNKGKVTQAIDAYQKSK